MTGATTVRVLNRDVHYVEHGAGERTLVALHGFTVDHRLMTGWLEPCFEGRDGWRRVYLDLPGMGRTSGAGIGSTDELFEVVRAAVDALAPGSYALAGSSYGGYLARGLVAAHGERVLGLALSVPVMVPEHEARQVPEHRVLRREAGLEAPEGFDEFNVVVTTETIAQSAVQIDAGVAIANAATIARVSAHYAGSFAVDRVGGTVAAAFEGPSLVLLGRQDHVVGYRDQLALLEAYPRATWAALDTAGHNVTIEQPVLATALASEWLDRVEEL